MLRIQSTRGLNSLICDSISAASLVSRRNIAAISSKHRQAGSARVRSQASQFHSPPFATDSYDGANVDFGQSQNPNEQGVDSELASPSTLDAPNSGAFVPAPPSCVWQAELVNDVRLIGRVGTVPQFRLLRSGTKAVATTKIGVRGRGPDETSWIDVEFWDVHAYQVMHYVAKGVQIAIGGRLKRDTWTKRDGSKDSTLKVVASYLHIVTPNPPDTEATPWDGASFSSASTGEVQQDFGYNPPATAAAAQTAPRAPRAPLPKDQRLFNRWRRDPSVTWGTLLSEQGGTPGTMLNGLVEGCVGAPDVTPAELSRMASELQMGPIGEVFVAATEVSAAIDDVLAAQPGTTLDILRLKPVRERLLQGGGHQLMGQKIQRQEAGSGPMGASITYNQIRLIRCCKQKGIPLENLVTEMPKPVQQLLSAVPVPV